MDFPSFPLHSFAFPLRCETSENLFSLRNPKRGRTILNNASLGKEARNERRETSYEWDEL